MSELIDRKRFSADMRDFQNRVGIWRDEAEDTETRTRADAALATIIETKLILDKQPTVAAASPWHRVEERPDEHTNLWLHDERGNYHVGCISTYRGYTEYIDMDGNTLHDIDYWMPIEPPKEIVNE